MHERTERAIARLLFVFCCAVPTACVFLVVFVTWTPWYHNRQLAAIQANLSRETGLNVTIEDFDQVSPSKWSLHGIRIYEPETKLEVARVRRVTWIREEDRVGVSIHQPELQSPQLLHAWQMVHDRFLCRPELTNLPMKIVANDLTIHSETGSLSMRDILMMIKPRPNSVQATLQCLTAGRNRFPIKVDVTRDRSTDVPKTRWTLETGPTALPCSALAGYLPLLKRLGPDAEFTGTMKWESESNGGWLVDLGGSRFTAIDLNGVFENLPHSIRGYADLVLNRCRIVPGQEVDLSGTISSTAGWIRTSLLRSMENQLGFIIDPQSRDNVAGEAYYDLLAIHFEMDNWELTLTGDCSNQKYFERVRPGIAIFGGNREMAMSVGKPIPSTQLAHAIAPQHSELVPISKQTEGLLDLFVPPRQPVAANEGTLPSSRVKRVGHWSGGEPIQQR